MVCQRFIEQLSSEGCTRLEILTDHNLINIWTYPVPCVCDRVSYEYQMYLPIRGNLGQVHNKKQAAQDVFCCFRSHVMYLDLNKDTLQLYKIICLITYCDNIPIQLKMIIAFEAPSMIFHYIQYSAFQQFSISAFQRQ